MNARVTRSLRDGGADDDYADDGGAYSARGASAAKFARARVSPARCNARRRQSLFGTDCSGAPTAKVRCAAARTATPPPPCDLRLATATAALVADRLTQLGRRAPAPAGRAPISCCGGTVLLARSPALAQCCAPHPVVRLRLAAKCAPLTLVRARRRDCNAPPRRAVCCAAAAQLARATTSGQTTLRRPARVTRRAANFPSSTHQ